jgi:hypothetical protein
MREVKEFLEKRNNSKVLDQNPEFEEDWKSVGSLFEEKDMAAKKDNSRRKTPKKCQ